MGRPALVRPRVRILGSEHTESLLTKAVAALRKAGHGAEAVELAFAGEKLLEQQHADMVALLQHHVDIKEGGG